MLYLHDISPSFKLSVTHANFDFLREICCSIKFLNCCFIPFQMQLPPHEPTVVKKAVNHFLQVWFLISSNISRIVAACIFCILFCHRPWLTCFALHIISKQSHKEISCLHHHHFPILIYVLYLDFHRKIYFYSYELIILGIV